jgi:hypothetical protein
VEHRNLDFEIPVTGAQWQEIGRRAATLGPERAGLDWRADEPEVIHVYIRDEDAPSGFHRDVSAEDRYGRSEREVARFVFNDGNPYAQLDPPRAPDEPAITEQRERAMQTEFENWVRNKWHALMRDSGIHYERGHIPHG